MAIIKLEGVEKVYRTKEIETTALENVNLTIDKGEFVSIMGPSGCGKSTLLNIIGLLDTPTKGTVEVLGESTARFSDKKFSSFRNHNIGFVFQSFHLIPTLNVADNVALPLIYRNDVSMSERRAKVREVLDRLQISHRKTTCPISFRAASAREWP